MKKSELKARVLAAEQARADAELAVNTSAIEVRKLRAELDVIRKNWRPVPMTHAWQPRNPQCALCDEPRDAPRHNVAAEDDPTRMRIEYRDVPATPEMFPWRAE